MKELKLLFELSAPAFLLMLCMLSCKGSDNGEPETNKPVVVDNKNNTSNGNSIVSIDDKNFYKDNVKYSVEDGNLIVSGYNEAGFKGNAQIASQISYNGKTYEVAGIGDKAFFNCKILSSISMPSTVTYIGDSSFENCNTLTSISLPDRIKYLGKSAFAGCTNINSNIKIPNGIEEINSNAFYKCSNIKSITIPKDVKIIGDNVFMGCSSITSIDIPDNVEKIGKHAFDGCNNVITIKIGENTIYIGEYAFSNCSNLNEIYCNTKYLPYSPSNMPVFNNTNFDGTLFVPYNIVNDYINNWNWNQFVKIIGTGQYNEEDGQYRNVLIRHTHFDYAGLKYTILSYKNKEVAVGGIADYASQKLIIPEYAIDPQNIRYNCISIGANAFLRCKGITSIEIPECITFSRFDGGQFSECSNLISVNLPNNMTIIPIAMFSGCESLTDITIPENVTSIEGSAFTSCSSLNNITIPSKITSIEWNAFGNCMNLKNITILCTTPPTINTTTFEKYFLTSINVPAESIDAYKSAEVWKDYADIIKAIPE